jgi:uncharacterized protein YbbC (DUF1343 family)
LQYAFFELPALDLERDSVSNRVILIILLLVSFSYQAYADIPVLPGIDVLAARNFDILKGKNVGLITNHTGLSRDGRSTIDILTQAPGVRLVALFSPEHGIRGTDDVKISSGFDSITGLPIHSLYGASCRPTPDMLRGIEILLFDIQDIGTRFYTYIGTLSLAMKAAKKAGIPFVVLDRPNPIGGLTVGGAIPATILPERTSGCGSITSIHPIPTRHGMTIGELARLFNIEFGIGCKLTVIPMQGWRRTMLQDATGLNWVNPSPNMKSLDAAILYPGLGVLETTNLSVGRGTDRPFQMFGAPWIDAGEVLANLERRKIPGLIFSANSFIPGTPGHPHAGKRCFGVKVTVTDRGRLDPIVAGLHLIQAFYESHPERFRSYEGFATETGDREVWALLTGKRMKPELVAERWNKDLVRFKEMRERYLLY